MSDQYYVEMDGKDAGPFTLNQLRAMWNASRLTGETLYTQPSFVSWHKLSSIMDKLEPEAAPPPERHNFNPSTSHYPSQPQIVRVAKSRGTYIILGLFLGCLGIHNFYAGRNGHGAFQLIMTLLLGWVIIGLVISGLIALVEVITVDEDGDGVKMV